MLSKPERARRLDQIARLFVGLHAMNRLLHLGMKILDAEAQAIESQLAQRFEMRVRGDARDRLRCRFRRQAQR